MQIHNFLCDLLASTRLLIDNYLLSNQPGLIKSYEFNLGNRTFQLGAEPTSTYALPAVIINIQDESINFGGRRSDLIQQNQLANINKIPVLSLTSGTSGASGLSTSTPVTVYVHEEQTVVTFSISINCESQMQAKEIAYRIKKILPLYKNINIFEFTTFLEIDNNILFDVLNYNVTKDVINNLYTKINHNTGNVEYCFSLKHNPLIRLDSVGTSISDSTQSTFQVQLELAYVISFPQHLVIDEYHLIQDINFSFNMNNWPIVMDSSNPTHVVRDNEPTEKIDRTLVVDSEITYAPSGILISKTETQVFLSIQFELTDFNIDCNKYNFRFRKSTKPGKTRDEINLTPTFVYEPDNKIVFVFTLEEYEVLIPTTSDPLFIDFYYDL
jgi:hypothetical protein